MNRVLVVRLDGMGDVLLAGPAVRAVSAAADEVWMLCSHHGASAARMLPGVHDVLVWDCPWISPEGPTVTGRDTQKLITVLQSLHFTQAIVLTSFHQSALPMALLLRLAGVDSITAASTDHAGSLLDRRLIPGEDFAEDIPEAERALIVVGAAGFTLPSGDDGALAVTDAGDSPVALTTPYTVVHPGADAPARRWSAARFARLVQLLAAHGTRVVVTGGPDERALTAQVSGHGMSGIDLGGRLSLPAFAAVLRAARMLLCGNTGPAHLAAAVSTPVVSLFSPVVAATAWAPYRVPHIIMGDQRAVCRGTRSRICPIPGHPCLDALTPGTVAGTCERLAEWAGARS